MKKEIPIDPSGNAPDTDLYRDANDQACWINEGKTDRIVVFPNGSPFSDDQYSIPAGQTLCSGPIINPPGKYPYDIRAKHATSDAAADPNLIVH